MSTITDTPLTRKKLEKSTGNPQIDKFIEDWLNRTPEEFARVDAELRAMSRPPRPLPPGKTLEDVVVGAIDFEMTDEEFDAMLKDI